jgi:Flp pilus assembly protein TadG
MAAPRTISPRNDAGTAIVELALVLPLLMALLLGIFDFGRALNYWNDANQIAADGARFAAVNRNPGAATPETFQSWLRKQGDTAELRNGGGQAAPLRVCVTFRDTNNPANGVSNDAGDAVEVEVRSKFALMPLVDVGVKVGIIGRATMRLEAKATNIKAG